jgi:NifU-like protein
VRYSGACAGCGAAGGATLYFIEDQLRQNVYYDLSVEPDFSGMEELTRAPWM